MPKANMSLPRRCLLLNAIFIFQALANADVDYYVPGKVMELTQSNFDLAVARFPFLFVDFYAPWCGHCKALAPELDDAAPSLVDNSPPIMVAKIDVEKFTSIASKFKIDAFPTLKLFIDGKPTDYSGPRQAVPMTSYLKKIAAPVVTKLNTDSSLTEFLRSVDRSSPVFIGFELQDSGFEDLAKDYKTKAWFAVANEPSEKIMDEYDFDKVPAVVALHLDHNEEHVFYGPFEGQYLAEFIQQNLLPLVTVVTNENLQLLKEDGRKIMLTFLEDDSGDSASVMKQLKAIAPANRDFIFAVLDYGIWKDFAEDFHLKKGSKMPQSFIWNGKYEYYTIKDSAMAAGLDEGLHISMLLKEFKDGIARKNYLRRPSLLEQFLGFASQNFLYIILFVVGTLMVLQNTDWRTGNPA